MRPLYNQYSFKEDGLFFSSLRGVGHTLRPVSPTGWKRGRRPRLPGLSSGGLVFSAPLHQSLHKSPPSFLGWQEMSGFSKASQYLYFSMKYTPIVKKAIKKSCYRVKVLEQVISRVLFPVLVTLYGTMVIHLFPLLLMG